MVSMCTGLAAEAVSTFPCWLAALLSVAKRAGEVRAGAGVAKETGWARLPAKEANEKPREGEPLEKGVEGRVWASRDGEPSPCRTSMFDAVWASDLEPAFVSLGSLPRENRGARA